MEARFFATVIAPDRRRLRELQAYDMDLFAATSKRDDKDAFIIDGLLTMEEVGRLVADGYQVLVREHADKIARARAETIEFEEWIKGMEQEA